MWDLLNYSPRYHNVVPEAVDSDVVDAMGERDGVLGGGAVVEPIVQVRRPSLRNALLPPFPPLSLPLSLSTPFFSHLNPSPVRV